MKKTFLLLSILPVILAGCERMSGFVRATEFLLELDTREAGKELPPDLYRICFFDAVNGNYRTHDFTSAAGGIVSVPPGRYNAFIYGFGSGLTLVDGMENWETACARTPGDIAENPFDGIVVLCPDPLYAVRTTDVKVPEKVSEEKKCLLKEKVEDILFRGRIEVGGIRGAENLSAATVYLTNMNDRMYINGRDDGSAGSCVMKINCLYDSRKNLLMAEFDHFGYKDGKHEAFVLLTDRSGNSHLLVRDISEMFRKPREEGLLLQVQEDFTVPEPVHGGGGLLPSLGEWDEQRIQI